MGISSAFITSWVMMFNIGLVGGVLSDDVGLCIVLLLMVLSRFDSIGGGVKCMLVHSLYEVGMVAVKPYEGCVNGMFSGVVVYSGIIPGVFALVTLWYVRGAKHIYVVAVGVDDVWVVFVGVDVTFYAAVPNIFTNMRKASPWRIWKV